MILALVFAHCWGVVQLVALGSLSRTMGTRTALAALTAGLYACAPLAVILQVGWTRPVAWLTGTTVASIVNVAAYTADPFLEEAIKVLPLAMLLVLPVIRRQWSLTDCVLLAGATGAGFGLAEELYRYNTAAISARAISDGWVLDLGRSVDPWVPSITTSLRSWLPDPISFTGEGVRLNEHMVWSAIAGLAVGLIVLRRNKSARLVAAGLLLYVGLDHAGGNAIHIEQTWLAVLALPLRGLGHVRGAMPIAALAVAWWLDRPRQRADLSRRPLLCAERPSWSPMAATFDAALSRPPWSLIWVDHFVRTRRAYERTRIAEPAQAADALATVIRERDRVDMDLARTKLPSLYPPGWTLNALRQALHRPQIIVWLVLMLPSLLWFVVGGWPLTAGIQALMIGPVVWKVLSLISAANQVWVGWKVIVGIRKWSQARLLPSGDAAAIMCLRVACSVGSVGLGGFAWIRMLHGVPASASVLYNLHAGEAFHRMTAGGAAMVANAATVLNPPRSAQAGTPAADAADANAAAAEAARASGAAAAANAEDGAPDHQPDSAPEPDRDSTEGAQSAGAAAGDTAAANSDDAAPDHQPDSIPEPDPDSLEGTQSAGAAAGDTAAANTDDTASDHQPDSIPEPNPDSIEGAQSAGAATSDTAAANSDDIASDHQPDGIDDDGEKDPHSEEPTNELTLDEIHIESTRELTLDEIRIDSSADPQAPQPAADGAVAQERADTATADAAAAKDRAPEAEADASEAGERRQRAVRAADAAENAGAVHDPRGAHRGHHTGGRRESKHR